MHSPQRCWAIIPAAGSGKRMGLGKPKQYLKLHNKYMLEYSVRLFCNYDRINTVVVVLNETDSYWQLTKLDKEDKVITTHGGKERCHSVQNGLQAIKAKSKPDDWVFVHDAVRPCLQREDLDKMFLALENHPVGGILAVPVKDTIKRLSKSNILLETVNRKGLWHALTPQLFRFGLLDSALKNAIENGNMVTDEAEAIELSGKYPMLIEGSSRNIKITKQSDIELASLYLMQQEDRL